MTDRFEHLELARPLVVIDTETTGCDPGVARVVELAAVKYFPDREIQTYDVRLNPGVPIPAAATAVHGITDADVANRPRFADVAEEIVSFLRGADLAGYNVKAFDLPLLAAEFGRYGIELDLRGVAVLDPLQVYFDRERRDLGAAVRFYCGRDHVNAHEALADVLAAAAVLDAQLGRYPDLPRNVAGLHRAYCPVDLAGKFRLEGGRIAFAFGKHAGRRLAEVAAEDPRYLRWLLAKDPLPDARRILREALRRFAPAGRC